MFRFQKLQINIFAIKSVEDNYSLQEKRLFLHWFYF